MNGKKDTNKYGTYKYNDTDTENAWIYTTHF